MQKRKFLPAVVLLLVTMGTPGAQIGSLGLHPLHGYKQHHYLQKFLEIIINQIKLFHQH